MIEIDITGLRELEQALAEIEKDMTRRSLARRVLKKVAQPVADVANQNAPVDPESTDAPLAGSYVVGTKLTKRQRREERRGDRDDVVMFVGTSNPAGVQQEFGNRRHSPQPHFRPAWDADREGMLRRMREELAREIEKTVARQRVRAARG